MLFNPFHSNEFSQQEQEWDSSFCVLRGYRAKLKKNDVF